MGTGINKKVTGEAGVNGKFTATELNLIVSILDKAMGTYSGEEGLKDALGAGGIKQLYIKRDTLHNYIAYELKDYKLDGTLANPKSLKGTTIVNIISDEDTIFTEGIKTLKITLEDNTTKILTGDLKKLDKDTNYTVVVDLDKQTFKIVNIPSGLTSFKGLMSQEGGFTIGTITDKNNVPFMTITNKDKDIGFAIVDSPVTLTVNGEDKTYGKNVYIYKNGELFRFVDGGDTVITGGGSNTLDVIDLTGLKDSNDLAFPSATGTVINVGIRSLLITDKFTYTKKTTDTKWTYTGDSNAKEYLEYSSDFIADFTCVMDASITFPSGNMKYVKVGDNTYKNYTSGTQLIGGNYRITGTGITSIKFVNDNFRSIHIERNSEQTNATDMFIALTKLTNFTAKPDTFASVTNMNSAWHYCKSLTTFPVIDTSKVTNMYNAWYGCNSLTSFPLIDTSKVTNMRGSWARCNSLTSFPAIDISKVTNMRAAWWVCTSLTSFPAIDISNVTNLYGTWNGCTSLVCMEGLTNNGTPPTDTSDAFYNTNVLLRPNATEQASILAGDTWINDLTCDYLINGNNDKFESTFTCTGDVKINYNGNYMKLFNRTTSTIADYTTNTIIPAGTYTIHGDGIVNIDFLTDNFTSIHIERNSEQTDAIVMCENLTKLTSFTAKPDTFAKVTNMYNAWYGCNSLTTFPVIDTSKVTNMYNAWYGCNSLTSFPLIDTSSVTNMDSAWCLCSSLTSFPLIDTSNVTNMDKAWRSCNSLTSFPLIDTSNVTNMRYAWNNCSSLTSFPLINISKVTTMYSAWQGSTSLICMEGLTNNGIAPTDKDLVFNVTPALLRPNATEQVSILAGNTWINDTPC